MTRGYWKSSVCTRIPFTVCSSSHALSQTASAKSSPHFCQHHYSYMHCSTLLQLSLSSKFCHTTFSLINLTSFSLSSATLLHLINKCSTSSTSSLWQLLHSLLFSTHALPSTSLNLQTCCTASQFSQNPSYIYVNKMVALRCHSLSSFNSLPLHLRCLLKT